MGTRLMKHLMHAAAYVLVIPAFIITSVPVAQAEALFLSRSPEVTASTTPNSSHILPQKIYLKLDEKGDLLIQCGCARFTVAYNSPAGQFKPPEQQYIPQREDTTSIFNGISLTASLMF
jgi:hypothetical protein